MDLTDPARYCNTDPFILGVWYRYGIYVGRHPDGLTFVFRTQQTDSEGRYLWNGVNPIETELVEDLVEEYYINL